MPTLYVQGQERVKTDKEKYLGNILSLNTKLDENILTRFNTGIGWVNQILSTLKDIPFGIHFFLIEILFRNSKLINGILRRKCLKILSGMILPSTFKTILSSVG